MHVSFLLLWALGLRYSSYSQKAGTMKSQAGRGHVGTFTVSSDTSKSHVIILFPSQRSTTELVIFKKQLYTGKIPGEHKENLKF